MNWLRKPLDRILAGRRRAHDIGDRSYFCLDSFLVNLVLSTEEFFFVQIWANDGVSFDPIYPIARAYNTKVKGIVVEPTRDAFEQLCRNYENFPAIIKVNKAIHTHMKEMSIHKVDPERLSGLPNWSRGIAS